MFSLLALFLMEGVLYFLILVAIAIKRSCLFKGSCLFVFYHKQLAINIIKDSLREEKKTLPQIVKSLNCSSVLNQVHDAENIFW